MARTLQTTSGLFGSEGTTSGKRIRTSHRSLEIVAGLTIWVSLAPTPHANAEILVRRLEPGQWVTPDPSEVEGNGTPAGSNVTFKDGLYNSLYSIFETTGGDIGDIGYDFDSPVSPSTSFGVRLYNTISGDHGARNVGRVNLNFFPPYSHSNLGGSITGSIGMVDVKDGVSLTTGSGNH